jgi:hypothetical protein
VKDNKVNECTLITKLKGEGSCGGGKKHIHTHTHTQNTKVRKLVQKFFISSRRRRRRRRRRIKLLSPR